MYVSCTSARAHLYYKTVALENRRTYQFRKEFRQRQTQAVPAAGESPPPALAPKAPALVSTWAPHMPPECPVSSRTHRERCCVQRRGNRQIRVGSIRISGIRQNHKSELLTGWKTTFLCARHNWEAVRKHCLTVWGTESRWEQCCPPATLRLSFSAPPSS